MLEKIIKGIDWLIDRQGRFSSLLGIPLVVIVVYEVFMRYVFNKPTIWGFEVTAFIYGMHFMLGLSFMENTNGHVTVDIITIHMKPKTKAILGAITYTFIFMPVFFLMTLWTFKFFWTSLCARELNSTSWAPPIYPIKFVMAVAFLFLLLQGISSLLKNIRILTQKHHEVAQ
jgi:TRAP-type mannitol/chloroaromatic compound transport system permease small subunit